MPTPSTLLNGATTCLLQARLDPSLHSPKVSARLIESTRLTTVHEKTFEASLYNTRFTETQLRRDNSFLPAADLELLDDRGLIRVGTPITTRTVLASILDWRLLQQDTPRTPSNAHDDSLVAPAIWNGATVTDASLLPASAHDRESQPDLTGIVRVTLRWIAPLAIGDVLLISSTPVTLAAITDSTTADLFLDAATWANLALPPSGACNLTVSLHAIPARWSVQSRATGHYSLITQQPLSGKSSSTGQPVRPAHVHTLHAAAMFANLAELVALKADDVTSRKPLRDALAGRGPFPRPQAPASLEVLIAHLAVLGLAAATTRTPGAAELHLTPMTDAQRRNLSRGIVTKSESIHYQTLKPSTGGYMCESIFGPEESPERRTRFGHIELPQPIVPFLFRMPGREREPSPLARRLAITDQQLAGLLDHQLGLDAAGTLLPFDPASDAQKTGAPAIESLLTRGNGSASDHAVFAARTILLTPPDLRPLVLLENGNFATSDLNDHYRQLIIHANRLRKLIELNAPRKILLDEQLKMQHAADALFANSLLPPAHRALDDAQRPLKDVLDMLTFSTGTRNFKRTDYSASARAVPLPIPSDIVLIPRTIAETLQVPERSPLLLTRDTSAQSASTPFVILRAALHDDDVIALPPQHFAALFEHPPEANCDPHECILHRPLSPEAINEAAQRIATPLTAPPLQPTWLDTLNAPALALKFRDAALTQSPIPLNSPAAILLSSEYRL